MLSKEEIQQFKKMYLQKFGEEISDEQAVEYAQTLLDLLTATYKPSRKNV